MKSVAKRALAALICTGLAVSSAWAAGCHKERNFDSWLKGVAKEAAAKGVSQQAIQAGLANVRFNQSIVDKDRAQGVFSQNFLQFSDRMVEQYRVKQAPGKIRQNQSVFNAIEQKYGVPAEVIVSFWGLETDFGAVTGDGPTLTSLATLAYDCRRPELFREQLIAALKIIDRGDLTAAQMRGPWAGEMGQLQFLPSHYYDYGVDMDGSGRVDLIKSSADALGSAGNYLASIGWRRGEPWLQEVAVPNNFPWEMADLGIWLPRSEWVAAGVKARSGNLRNDGLEAALLLPMGKDGPAFLAYPNFLALLEWNSSLVYTTSAAYFATRIDGAPKVKRGGNINHLSAKEVMQLQKILSRKGYDVGKIDGIIGAKTRAAVKRVQLELGMPADSYPTRELLQRLS